MKGCQEVEATVADTWFGVLHTWSNGRYFTNPDHIIVPAAFQLRVSNVSSWINVVCDIRAFPRVLDHAPLVALIDASPPNLNKKTMAQRWDHNKIAFALQTCLKLIWFDR